MIIKSDFKDYYDYLGHAYGQDPMIIYVRTRRPGDMIRDTELVRGKFKDVDREADHFSTQFKGRLPGFNLNVSLLNFRAFGFMRPPEINDWRVRAVYVCGKAYAVVEHVDVPAHAFNDESPLHALLAKHKLDDLIAGLQPVESTEIERMHRQIKLPIFEIDPFMFRRAATDHTINIKCRPPNLGDLRFARIYPAEQIWQDLSYWIINKINESPDMMPPPRPPQTDMEKLQSHGFDRRISFRNRC